MAKTLQIDGLIMRHDTWENWTADDADILLEGELGFVVDDSDHNGEMRIGGVGGTTWLNSKILNSGGGEPVDLSEYTKTVDLPTARLTFHSEEKVIDFTWNTGWGGNVPTKSKKYVIAADGSCTGQTIADSGMSCVRVMISRGTKIWFGNEAATSYGFNWTITDISGNPLLSRATDKRYHDSEADCLIAPLWSQWVYVNVGASGFTGSNTLNIKTLYGSTIEDISNRIPGVATEDTYGTIRGSSSYGYGFVANNGIPYAKTVTKAQYATSSQNMFISKGTLDNIKEDFGSGDMLKSEYATNGTTGVVDKAVSDKNGNDIVETYVSTDEIGTEIDSVGINADTLGGFAADEFVRVGDAGVSVEEVEEVNAGSLAGFPANTFAQVEFYDTSDMVAVPVNADTLEGHRANEFVTHTEIEESKEYILPETVIGKWYNGKPIYRKIIITKTPSAAGANKVAEIRNLGTVINLSGFVQRPEGVQQIPVNFYFDGNYRTAIYFQGNDIMMIASGYGNLDVTFIIEYTKTTDD